MGYCNDDRMVRVDFFKESGRGYTIEATEAVDMVALYCDELFAAFGFAIRKHLIKAGCSPDSRSLEDYKMTDLIAVCTKPFHSRGYPMMVKVKDCITNESYR